MPKAKLTDINKRRAKQDEFVKRPNIQMSKRSDVQTPNRKRTTVYLSPELHKELKRAALDKEREMSELVEDAVREYLKTLAS